VIAKIGQRLYSGFKRFLPQDAYCRQDGRLCFRPEVSQDVGYSFDQVSEGRFQSLGLVTEQTKGKVAGAAD
jgi:hypothetical protein